ncbi:methyltransferase family protein [Mumia flava]|uniref:Methyltransferase family protein n=1 Tax=Mumia flava TaxID=1348852 RepID=A0A0B2B2I2_9ACTN|nr:class I SAM-dependent methyltransferase [Mumia flava]PJJ54132.1 methyltransferase family protein [Mumia flava]
MGWYSDHVLPRWVDRACGMEQADPYRARVCAGLSGDVVEIGFGSGHNTRFYPPAVRSVAAVEPSDAAWRIAEERIVRAHVPVVRSGLDGQALTLDDDSVDAALSTWTMCTIPDLDAALAELRRVLRPGGTLHFLEHGLAPDESVRRWQRRLAPLHQRIAGGCHLTRRIVAAIERAGFEVREVDVFYEDGAPKVLGADALGLAVNPADPPLSAPGP